MTSYMYKHNIEIYYWKHSQVLRKSSYGTRHGSANGRDTGDTIQNRKNKREAKRSIIIN